MKKTLAYLFMICGVVPIYFEGILPGIVLFILQIIGYISMPFFAQALVDGFFLTKNTYQYFLRVTICAYLTQAASFLAYLIFADTPQPRKFNIAFTWMVAFAVLFALELLVSLPRDRIASLNLLHPNQTTHATRFDVVVSSSEANHLPKGMKIPSWPRSTLQGGAILLIALSMVIVTFLPLTMPILSLVAIVGFYFLHRWKIDSRIFVVTIFFSAFAACYTYAYFRMTGRITYEWAAIAGFVLCLLIPGKRRRKRKIYYRVLYLIYPLAILGCAGIATLVR